jgi:hypothetical protein
MQGASTQNGVQEENPAFYGRDELILIARDPYSLFAYWELTWERRELLSQYVGQHSDKLQKYLRLYDVTNLEFLGDNAHAVRDIDVHHDAYQWYINPVDPGRNYILDYGCFFEGRFLPLLRSNVVLTPRQTPAAWGEPLTAPISTADNQKQGFENFLTYTFYE